MTYSNFLNLLATSNAYGWKLLPHDQGIVLEANVKVRVMRPETSSDDDLRFTAKWADPEAYMERCTAFYGASPVAVFDIVSVASGRALIPFAGEGVAVSAAHEKVARALHCTLNGHPDDYEAYISKAGIEVEGEK